MINAIRTMNYAPELCPTKCAPPMKSLEWLGFMISAQNMTVTIPTEKLDNIIAESEL